MTGYNQSPLDGTTSAAPTAVQPLVTLLAPNVSMNTVKVCDPPSKDQPNYQQAALDHAAQVAGALAVNLRTAAALQEAMDQRAGEALAAETHVAGTAFSARMESPTGLELGMAALSMATGGKDMALFGGGSFATGGKAFEIAGGAADITNVLNDRTMSEQDAQAEVATILAYSSSPAAESAGMVIQDANMPARVDIASGMDWGAALDQHGPRAMIAAVEFDLQNPSADMPEVAELMQAIAQQTAILNEYDAEGLFNNNDEELEARIAIVREFLDDDALSGAKCNAAFDTGIKLPIGGGGSSTDQDLEAQAARAATRFDMTSTAI